MMDDLKVVKVLFLVFGKVVYVVLNSLEGIWIFGMNKGKVVVMELIILIKFKLDIDNK